MLKRIMTVAVLAVMVFSLFAGCNSYSTISPQKAQSIAMKDAGVKQKDVDDVHAHAITEDGEACYNIHITVGNVEYDYTIRASDGEIIAKSKAE